MTTDPGDLVLDPTCGSGTTAYVAEQWGRRWITIDTSRVALALSRARLMGARYPFYLLADSPEGVVKDAALTGKPPAHRPTRGDIRQGFVYQRVPHIQLKDIANNAEIDVIWEKWQAVLEPLRARLNELVVSGGEWRVTGDGKSRNRRISPDTNHPSLATPPWEEWQIPRQPGADWPEEAKSVLAHWWEARIARQREIDKSIADKADQEFLYDKPYEDSGKVRVAGPFTVESLSPHRVVPTDDDTLWEEVVAAEGEEAGRPIPRRRVAPHKWQEEETDFARIVLDHLKASGVHQGDKKHRITFTSVTPWPGRLISAVGWLVSGDGWLVAGDEQKATSHQPPDTRHQTLEPPSSSAPSSAPSPAPIWSPPRGRPRTRASPC